MYSMNLRWSLVKDRVKDGGGGASTNALRNPHLVRGLGFWQCGGCAPRDDERGRRPARRGLRHTRIRRHQRRLAYRPTAPAPRSRTHPASAGPARSAVARDGRSGHSRGVPPRGVPAPARIPGSAMHPRTPDPAISAGRLASGYTSSYDHGRRRRGYPCVNHDCAGSAVSATTRTSYVEFSYSAAGGRARGAGGRGGAAGGARPAARATSSIYCAATS